jgi:hypothetical protein
MEKIEVVEPEDFIKDAAAPLLNICQQMGCLKEVQQAREHIAEAQRLLNEAFALLR